MFYHVDRKFPDAMAVIETLASTDPAFALMLADFEEICTWLASSAKAASSNEREIENAAELARELETEIRHKLEQHHDVTR